MFLFGILSSPLPYLLMAAFYFIGFATGMFHREKADSDENLQVQTNNIQVAPSAVSLEKAEQDFQYYQYFFSKKVTDCTLSTIQPPPDPQNRELIYFVHEIKIPFTSVSDFFFCRPPPNRS